MTQPNLISVLLRHTSPKIHHSRHSSSDTNHPLSSRKHPTRDVFVPRVLLPALQSQKAPATTTEKKEARPHTTYCREPNVQSRVSFFSESRAGLAIHHEAERERKQEKSRRSRVRYRASRS